MIFNERFPMDADSYEEALHYLKNRALQLKRFGVKFTEFKDIGFGVEAHIDYDREKFSSIYVYKSHRGKNILGDYVLNSGKHILTIEDCGIEEYLRKKSIPHVIIGSELHRPAYKLIDKIYGDWRSERSMIFFMNHIDEGLYILNCIGANMIAKDGYCLHPIVQSDDSLLKYYTQIEQNNFIDIPISTAAFITAMEYRRVANAYLSKRVITSLDEIELSILPEVNQMLIADKVQNRKDFELYHLDTHPRSKELQEYFKNWLERLGVSEEQYQVFKKDLMS